MASLQALRVGDPVACTCFCKGHRCPNGKIVTGATRTLINNRLAALARSITSNCCGSCCKCPNHILRGSTTVFIEGRGVARISDPISCGRARQGSTNTFIG